MFILYSSESPQKVDGATPGSVSYVPSVAGLMIAGYVNKRISEGGRIMEGITEINKDDYIDNCLKLSKR